MHPEWENINPLGSLKDEERGSMVNPSEGMLRCGGSKISDYLGLIGLVGLFVLFVLF